MKSDEKLLEANGFYYNLNENHVHSMYLFKVENLWLVLLVGEVHTAYCAIHYIVCKIAMLSECLLIMNVICMYYVTSRQYFHVMRFASKP